MTPLTVDTQIYLASVGLVVGSLVTIWQAFKLRGIYRVKSAWVGAVVFLLLGGRQVKGLLQLKAVLATTKYFIIALQRCGVDMHGVTLDRLSKDQWLNIIWSYAIIIGFIVWQDMQHRELRRANMIS